MSERNKEELQKCDEEEVDNNLVDNEIICKVVESREVKEFHIL